MIPIKAIWSMERRYSKNCLLQISENNDKKTAIFDKFKKKASGFHPSRDEPFIAYISR